MAETLANHGARLDNVEREQTAVGTKLDRLLFWIMGTLATSIIALAAIMFKR